MTTAYPMIHGAGMASIYAAMLRKLPIESVRDFWRSHPLRIRGKLISEKETYQYLWSEGCYVPADYFAAVLNGFEPFVNEIGFTLGDFEECLDWKTIWTGTMGKGDALEWLQPLFREFFESEDPMLVGIKAIGEFCLRGFPGCGVWQLRFEESGAWREVWLAFAPDRDFRCSLRYEPPFVARVFLRSFPRILGLPAVDDIGIQADCREVPEVLRHVEWRMDCGELFIQGERFARVILFSEFCERMGFDFGSDTIPDCNVFLVEKDFFCPERKRVVLVKGCAYGAPCYIASWRYRLDYKKPSNPFAHLAIEVSRSRPPEWLEMEAIHLRLLSDSSAKSVWVYHRKDEILVVDGRKMFKGAQARILRKILKVHLEEGETRFAFRRFKYDREVVEDPKRSNLELHLKRISEKLAGIGHGLRLEFSVKGQITLQLEEGKVELRDL